MGVLAFSVLGPIGSILGGYLATFFTFLSETAAWAPAVLVGGFLPLMVMFGLHNGVAPLGVMQMANLGYDSIFGPGCLCSNMAQATAGAVVAFRTRDKQTKQIATSGFITAYMGITEPILYGISLPKKYPLVATIIGGACGGLYAGLTHTHRFATGSSGLPAVLLYLGNNTTKCFINIIIAIVISAVVSGVLTFILSYKFENTVVETEDKTEEKEETKEIEIADKIDFASPVKGKVLPLSDAKDEVFASGALGKGAVIVPSEGKVVAPFDAKIGALFQTKHAVCLVGDNGLELMIHIGIDTVKLEGKCFEAFVKQDDHVKAGDVLVEFDIEGIKESGYSEQTMLIMTNSDAFGEVSVDSGFDTDGSEPIIHLNDLSES